MKVINEVEPTPHGKLTNAAVKRVWEQFIKHGSNHSARGFFLTHIINRCERDRISYKLIALPGQGYWIVPCNQFGDDAI